jgi:hypothetical protein
VSREQRDRRADDERGQAGQELVLLPSSQGRDLVRHLVAVERVEVGQDRRRLVDVVVERVEPVVGRAPARDRLGRLDVGRGGVPDLLGLSRELPLLLRGQGLKVVEAPVDQRPEGDEPPARGRVILLDRGLAQVVGLHEQVPDLLDALGLLDGLLAELLERRDRLAERDQPGRGHRRDRQQHGRQRQPQPPSKRPCSPGG